MNSLQKTSKYILKTLALAALLISCTTSSATHLLGGYISYEHIGDSLYEIKLRIYRDCNQGTLRFSDSADITVVDQNFSEVLKKNFAKGPTIPVIFDSIPCMFRPPGICVEYADYIDTVALPPLPGGYTAYYRECCRNQLIVNIPQPLNTSYVYLTEIPSMDILGNTSPQLLGEPALFLCQDKPIDLKIETYEPDGDSLHFELCDIMERHSGMTPYRPIAFFPQYSSQYPMDASPPFQIHPQTGQITGTPTNAGHYVVGICVREYRNGLPISTVRFDYQFNVTSCRFVESDMLTQQEDSSLFCGGLTVNFTDESNNADSVIWDFGDTVSLSDVSKKRNPSYTYPKSGTYSVRLIADPGSDCADTTVETFVVQEEIAVDFFNEGEYCFSEQPISFAPQGSYPQHVTYHWDFGPDASDSVDTGPNPWPVSWAAPGKYYVELTVKRAYCSYSHGDTVVIKPELKSDMIVPAERPNMTCNGFTVPFVSESKNATSVFWDFGDGNSVLDTSTLDSVLYTYPAPGSYDVTLIAFQDDLCTDTAVHTIEVHEPLEPRIAVDGEDCFEAQDINFSAVGHYPQGTEFTWRFGPLAKDSIKKGADVSGISWTEPGKHPVRLTTRKGFCEEEVYDTLEIKAFTALVEAGDTQRVKEGDRFYLNATSDAPEIYWSSDQPVSISSPFSYTTAVDLSVTGIDSVVPFYARVTDTRGCDGLDTAYVIIDLNESERTYNVISPNGDGLNDALNLSGLMRGQDCKLTILNRWGSEVYHADRYENNWEGVDDQGRLLPDGTYYYVVFCDPRVRSTGPITIVRSGRRN